jgi:uncharacterized surface protein with fasciclin (FAS1) repeats
MSDRSSVIDTIEKDGKFSTFAAMLKTSGAAELITGAGPFTVFAPTNDAFKKVPEAQMAIWQGQDAQSDLAKLLSYHLVGSKKIFASRLGSEGPAATLSGADLTFSDDSGLKVNDSKVQARNIEATNGIIHALDTVLTPPVNELAASAAAAGTAATSAPIASATLPTAQADGHSDVPAEPSPATVNETPSTSAPDTAPLPATPKAL